MKRFVLTATLSCVMGLAGTLSAVAQEQPLPEQPQRGADVQIRGERTQIDVEVRRDEQRIEERLIEHDQLIGETLFDQQGREFGQLEDLVVSTRDGHIRFVVVSSEAVEDRLYAVPLNKLHFQRQDADEYQLVLQMDQQELAQAPAFSEERWDEATQTGFWNEVTQLFEGAGQRVERAFRPEERRDDVRRDDVRRDDLQRPDEQRAGQDEQPDYGLRASELDGIDVRDLRDENVGHVSALVISMHDEKVAYATVESGGFLGLGAATYAIPMEKLQLRGEVDDPEQLFLLIHMTEEQLEQAPQVEDEAASTHLHAQVKQYFQLDAQRRDAPELEHQRELQERRPQLQEQQPLETQELETQELEQP